MDVKEFVNLYIKATKEAQESIEKTLESSQPPSEPLDSP